MLLLLPLLLLSSLALLEWLLFSLPVCLFVSRIAQKVIGEFL